MIWEDGWVLGPMFEVVYYGGLGPTGLRVGEEALYDWVEGKEGVVPGFYTGHE